jgi:hypothetical protein
MWLRIRVHKQPANSPSCLPYKLIPIDFSFWTQKLSYRSKDVVTSVLYTIYHTQEAYIFISLFDMKIGRPLAVRYLFLLLLLEFSIMFYITLSGFYQHLNKRCTRGSWYETLVSVRPLAIISDRPHEILIVWSHSSELKFFFFAATVSKI